jgi:hypothetical protein
MKNQISTIVGMPGKQKRPTGAMASNEMMESPGAYIMYAYEHSVAEVYRNHRPGGSQGRSR